jgi:predicted acetyltransferase
MRRVLQEARERGVAAAALYASTWALYRSVGFECAGTRHLATLSPAQVPVLEHGLPVRQATHDDRPAVEALYRELAPAYDGHLDRGGYIWPRLYDVRFGVAAHGLLVHDDDGLAGYVYYRKHPPVAGSFRHRVEICDLLARSPAAWRRLWTVIADMSTMVETVELPSAPHDPLFLHHPEPRFRMTLLENFFARITDLVAFLEGRGYAPGMCGRVELLLHDDVLTDQSGAWCLEVQDGHGHVTRGGKGTVRIDARGLASWATGLLPLTTLSQLGRAEGPPAALRLADGLTTGPAPWMREMF